MSVVGPPCSLTGSMPPPTSRTRSPGINSSGTMGGNFFAWWAVPEEVEGTKWRISFQWNSIIVFQEQHKSCIVFDLKCFKYFPRISHLFLTINSEKRLLIPFYRWGHLSLRKVVSRRGGSKPKNPWFPEHQGLNWALRGTQIWLGHRTCLSSSSSLREDLTKQTLIKTEFNL